ncbi:sensor histidine kinase [Sphingomonas sp. R1]|uniref:sensor histidine kinase n=1 Tax=Sphingomonas sp. R1 TaxID=399176 RepID=UPI002224586C|nr:GAF domain-containing sensor histidine kinase [Sphingomonas sp. R1]UYY78691.1 GAF domain-containing sensor histidine kinase [Sphingomonas sp. R1]
MLTRTDLSGTTDQACDGGSDENVHRQLLELLADSASELLQAEDLAPALDRIFERIRTQLRLDVFFHYAFDEAAEMLDLAAWGGVPAERMQDWRRIGITEGVCATLVQERRVMIGENIHESDDPRHEVARGMGLRAFYGTPLLHKDRLLGTLAFGRRCCGRFSDTEVRFLQTLSSYVTLADHRIGVDRELRARLQERDRMLAERRVIERQMVELTRASALGSIAATVAHELNQPLAAATNYLAALRLAPSSDATAQGLAHSAEQQLHRAGEIIRRIRRMVRQDDLLLETRALAPVVEEAVLLVRAAAPWLLPPVTVDIAPQATHARFDNVQIAQVLANLLRNAGQACADRHDAAITVATRPHESGTVAVHVIDNGRGVAPALQPMLFQPGLGAPGREGRGMGLGLAISHHLVQGHGGKIWPEQTPGGGATFVFTLPAAHIPG